MNLRPPPAAAAIPTPARAPDKLAGTAIGDLLDHLAAFANDPLGFVQWAFPWGEPGSFLEHMEGPEDWQAAQLTRIGKRLAEGGEEGAVIEEDTVAGRGVGKSALVSWLVLWSISTAADTRGVVTANTADQLRTKTWAELSKWYGMFIAKRLFTLTATAIHIADDPDREKSWRIDALPWNAERPEAFNGLHNQGKRLLILFDEASGIDEVIWEGTEGSLSGGKTQILFLRYGNPTRTSGRFFSNCTNPRRNTVTRVDSRTVRFSNKKQIQDWIDEYGEDSDWVRVHVKGMFPRAGFSNFISPEMAHAASRRRLQENAYKVHPKIMSVDPARFGDDRSVITVRQGPMLHYQLALQGFDGVDLAGRIAELVRNEGPFLCIAYDAIGVGADLDSSLRRIPGLPTLIPVMWGVPAKDDKQYANQRAECWGKMRDWLESGQLMSGEFARAAEALSEEMCSVDYMYDAKFRIQIQAKKDIKKVLGRSCDLADSFAISFVPDLLEKKATFARVRPVNRRTVVWTR